MWYLAAKFESEEASGRYYKPLQDSMFNYNIDLSVYRMVVAGIWHIILIADTQPSAHIIKQAQKYLSKGVITQLDEGVLQRIFTRREENKKKATKKTPTGYAYEGHTPTPLLYDTDTPMPEKDVEATMQETKQYLEKYHNLHLQFEKPVPLQPHTLQASPHRPFIATFEEVSIAKDDTNYQRAINGSLRFTNDNDKQEASHVVALINKINRSRLKTCDKYLFTDSAMKLHEAVFNPHNTEDTPFPMDMITNHLWIELAYPLEIDSDTVKAVYVNNAFPTGDIERVVPQKHDRYFHEVMLQTYAPHIHQWSLDLITPSCDMLYDFTYDTLTKAWVFLASHICPSNECTYLTDEEKKYPLHTLGTCIPCIRCKAALGYWSKWLYTALEIIHKKYALSPDDYTFPTETQTYETEGMITVGKGKNKRRINEKITKKVDYKLVKFEVSVAPHSHKEVQDSTQDKRANWLTLHGIEERLYKKMHFSGVERDYTLPHYKKLIERCLQEGSFIEEGKEYSLQYNEDGTPFVRSKLVEYDRYVPMLATKHTSTIKKVVASQYEKSDL